MEDLLKRITFNKDVLCGKPLIRGLRISVELILELLLRGLLNKRSWKIIKNLNLMTLGPHCSMLII